MDDLKLFTKSEEEFQKQIQTVKTSVMIPIWNLDLKMCKDRIQKKQTYSLAKFSDRHKQRYTRARTGENVQYLGIEGSEGIQHQQMRERLKQE